MKKDKKALQLGMNPSTASHRLVKDILWSLVVRTGQGVCCKCGKEMQRETFSIEHLIPWLDSDNPQDLFFSLENISFSHIFCNISSARKTKQEACGTLTKYTNGCRCEKCRSASAEYARSKYTTENRRKRYKASKKMPVS